jgi:hypothetical protein
MQRFTTKIMPLIPRKTYRSVLMKGPNPDFGRITGNPEVIPSQKSASGKFALPIDARFFLSSGPLGKYARRTIGHAARKLIRLLLHVLTAKALFFGHS